ncbi:Uncharacterized conserved protein [Mycobacteroides abscessus subsp. bolletii]|uniref:DUF262 domain-containing protein n=1 Tax=Mycobacteroides abscessus TaxID=36809 RepID=UPI0009296A95|nr:DUF262 domain-containing protein [Mycobacteroides abscessus]SIJ89573.1 Uncharacterized conserved protein [Mycobacteroides abscessus subsp. bolletii]SLF81231.1 Uncharacterized conserved protein [Mycobacteroides abscessus subsp. bolletii]
MTVGEVMNERFPFAVPRYQRSYAWEDEAVGFFVRDIEAMLEEPAGQTSHFFGGVVCIQLTDNQRTRPTSYEVVDGQQRLATLMLALSCVVEVAEGLITRCDKKDPQVAASASTLRDEIVENFLTWKDSDVAAGVSTVRRRMTLSLADDALFEALVMRQPVPTATRESHTLLVEAHAALMEMTLNFVGTRGKFRDRVDRLLRMRQALLQDAHVIHIVSKERAQAYRLFSVLNHRGESLSDADLLRTRSLELLEGFPPHQEVAARLWDDLLSNKARDVELFFQAIYPSVTGKRAQGDLFEALEAQFLPSVDPTSVAEAKKVVTQVEWFRDEFLLYAKLAGGDWPYPRQPAGQQQVNRWQTERLRRLTVTLRHDLALPLLLAAARSLSEKDFAELVYMLEIFAFRYKIICGAHATKPSNLYYEHAYLMRSATKKKPYSLKALKQELRQLIADKAGDALFKQLLLEKLRYSNSSQRVNIREFLTILEDHQSWLAKPGSKQAGTMPKPSMTKVIDIEETTIEHIYPQNAGAADRDSALESKKHWLGNLTFFGPKDNSVTGNKSFAVKRTASFAASEITMTAQLAKLNAWTNMEFENREKKLLSEALLVFVI